MVVTLVPFTNNNNFTERENNVFIINFLYFITISVYDLYY